MRWESVAGRRGWIYDFLGSEAVGAELRTRVGAACETSFVELLDMTVEGWIYRIGVGLVLVERLRIIKNICGGMCFVNFL